MKSSLKFIVSLMLIILFLVACIVSIGGISIGTIMHTYQVFTAKEKVAEVTISEMKEDNLGKYADVEIRIVKNESTALTTAVTGNNSKADVAVPTQNFKLYGDVVYLSGPIVKFKDELIFLNFKTMFKLGKIYARYDLDNISEKNRPAEAFSSYDLNGGFAEWKGIHDILTSDTFLGSIYKQVLDTTQVSSAGQYISNKPLEYTVSITNNGFIWELKN